MYKRGAADSCVALERLHHMQLIPPASVPVGHGLAKFRVERRTRGVRRRVRVVKRRGHALRPAVCSGECWAVVCIRTTLSRTEVSSLGTHVATKVHGPPIPRRHTPGEAEVFGVGMSVIWPQIPAALSAAEMARVRGGCKMWTSLQNAASWRGSNRQDQNAEQGADHAHLSEYIGHIVAGALMSCWPDLTASSNPKTITFRLDLVSGT